MGGPGRSMRELGKLIGCFEEVPAPYNPGGNRTPSHPGNPLPFIPMRFLSHWGLHPVGLAANPAQSLLLGLR